MGSFIRSVIPFVFFTGWAQFIYSTFFFERWLLVIGGVILSPLASVAGFLIWLGLWSPAPSPELQSIRAKSEWAASCAATSLTLLWDKLLKNADGQTSQIEICAF